MDMLVKLYDLPESRTLRERLAKAGISVRRALAPEKHKVTAWIRDNFSEGWVSETEVAFSRQPVSCFIAVKDGRITGFACHDATCRNFFGPTGVTPKTPVASGPSTTRAPALRSASPTSAMESEERNAMCSTAVEVGAVAAVCVMYRGCDQR